jgi:trehalose/maltose hydrolase-like predicted phosphorylase
MVKLARRLYQEKTRLKQSVENLKQKEARSAVGRDLIDMDRAILISKITSLNEQNNLLNREVLRLSVRDQTMATSQRLQINELTKKNHAKGLHIEDLESQNKAKASVIQKKDELFKKLLDHTVKEREKIAEELKTASNAIEEESLETRHKMTLEDFEAKADMDLIMQVTHKATKEITLHKLQNVDLIRRHETETAQKQQEIHSLAATIAGLKSELKTVRDENLKLKRGDLGAVRKQPAELSVQEIGHLIGKTF